MRPMKMCQNWPFCGSEYQRRARRIRARPGMWVRPPTIYLAKVSAGQFRTISVGGLRIGPKIAILTVFWDFGHLPCPMTRLSCAVLTGCLLPQVEPLAPSQQNNATRAAISSLAASLSPASVVASSACASEFAAPTPPPADAQQVRRPFSGTASSNEAWMRPHSANYKPDWVVWSCYRSLRRRLGWAAPLRPPCAAICS